MLRCPSCGYLIPFGVVGNPPCQNCTGKVALTLTGLFTGLVICPEEIKTQNLVTDRPPLGGKDHAHEAESPTNTASPAYATLLVVSGRIR